MSGSRSWWRAQLAGLPCVLCRRGWGGGYGRVELHHVATGSSKRHPDALAALCEGHHTGPAGLHGLGARAFVALYKPPDMHELGLVIWTIEDAIKRLYGLYGRKKRTPDPAKGRGSQDRGIRGRGVTSPS